MIENPWVYHESRNRLREEKEREKKKIEDLVEKFEKQREYTTTEKRFDIFELKHRIETGRNLLLLQKEIAEFLKEWQISRESFEKFQEQINILKTSSDDKKNIPPDLFSRDDFLFGNTDFVKFLEEKKIWENIFVDMVGFFYGFIVQWWAILVILFWKILLDIIFLPRDIYNEIKK